MADGTFTASTLKESHRQAGIAARETAYAEFLSSHRQFRRFIQTEPVKVTLVERPGKLPVPVIERSASYWEAAESTGARLETLAGERVPRDIWHGVIRAFDDVARARASCGPGEVPDEIILRCQAAEKTFADAARQDLIKSGAASKSDA